MSDINKWDIGVNPNPFRNSLKKNINEVVVQPVPISLMLRNKDFLIAKISIRDKAQVQDDGTLKINHSDVQENLGLLNYGTREDEFEFQEHGWWVAPIDTPYSDLLIVDENGNNTDKSDLWIDTNNGSTVYIVIHIDYKFVTEYGSSEWPSLPSACPICHTSLIGSDNMHIDENISVEAYSNWQCKRCGIRGRHTYVHSNTEIYTDNDGKLECTYQPHLEEYKKPKVEDIMGWFLRKYIDGNIRTHNNNANLDDIFNLFCQIGGCYKIFCDRLKKEQDFINDIKKLEGL